MVGNERSKAGLTATTKHRSSWGHSKPTFAENNEASITHCRRMAYVRP